MVAKSKLRPGSGGQGAEALQPAARKMIKTQISYIIFTLMLPYRNL